MEFILDIFQKLSIDSTFFIQLILTVVFYYVLKTILFSKLQFVLEMRDSKTTKMEDNANSKFVKAEKLSEKIDEEINQTYQQAQSQYNLKKNAFITKAKSELKQLEQELNKLAEIEKEKIKNEVRSHEEAILSQADELSESLVQKIIH